MTRLFVTGRCRLGTTTGFRSARLGVLGLIVVLASCGASTSPSGPLVATISVTGSPAALVVGDSVQFNATASLSDGSTRNVTTQAAWQSSAPAVASVSVGLVSALGSGTADISASYGGRTGSQSISVSSPIGLTCGVERWPVKTLADSAATSLNLANVQATTIKDLNLLPAHCSGIPSPRTYPPEFQVYEVIGQIIVARLEDDHDYHVALADPSDNTYTIVTEIADPQCEGAIDSPFRQILSQARAAVEGLTGGRALSSLVGTMVRVRGVGFYDFNHGQTGRSQSCLELHAVTDIRRAQ